MQQRCQCCPYGGFLAFPIVLGTAATLCTLIGTFGCNFYAILIEATSLNTIFSSDTDTTLGVGLWLTEDPLPYSVTCYGWKDIEFFYPDYNSYLSLDGPMIGARILSLLAAFISFPLMLFIFLGGCIRFNGNTYFQAMTIFCFIQGFLTLFCLVALASDICKNAKACALSTSGICCIIAAALWFFAGGSLLLLLANKPEEDDEPQPQGLRVVFAIATPNTAPPLQPPPSSSSSQRAVLVDDLQTIVVAATAPPTIAMLPPVSADIRQSQRSIKRIPNMDGSTTVLTEMIITHSDGSKTVSETTEVETSPLASAY